MQYLNGFSKHNRYPCSTALRKLGSIALETFVDLRFVMFSQLFFYVPTEQWKHCCSTKFVFRDAANC